MAGISVFFGGHAATVSVPYGAAGASSITSDPTGAILPRWWARDDGAHGPCIRIVTADALLVNRRGVSVAGRTSGAPATF